MANSVAFPTPASSSAGAQDKLQAVREAVDSVSKEINALSPSIPGANTSIQEKLQGLREAVDSLGREINSTPPHRPHTWTSVPITEVGTSTLLSTGNSAFDIPSVIPSTAKNVLVYAAFYTGNVSTSGYSHKMVATISTRNTSSCTPIPRVPSTLTLRTCGSPCQPTEWST